MKASSPSAERNRGPISSILQTVLKPKTHVLEIASGTGQHAAHFAEVMPEMEWYPTETDAARLPSISAWRDELAQRGQTNMRAPQLLNVEDVPWPVERVCDAVLCINMIHIAPWNATVSLFQGAAGMLRSRPRERIDTHPSMIITYGPYMRGGQHTAESNMQFDRALRSQNVRWGVRDLNDVQTVARDHGFVMDEPINMPANNFTVVWRYRGSQAMHTTEGTEAR